MSEQQVIGSILLDPTVADDIAWLSPEAFTDPELSEVYRTLRKMSRANQTPDVVTVASEGHDLSLLMACVKSTPSTANAPAYAELVREGYAKRVLKDAAAEVIQSELGSEELAHQMTRAAESIERKSTGAGLVSDLMPSYLDRLDAMSGSPVSGLCTGFKHWDRRTTGLHPGDLVIVAGRPGMGKTTFALDIARNVALSGGAVDVYSLEMPKEQLLHRYMAAMTDTVLQDVRSGKVDWKAVSDASKRLSAAKLWIDDRSGLTPDQIRASVRVSRRKRNCALVVIDYLQLMRCKSESRFAEVSEISRQCKALAKDCEVPVVLLSQLSRRVEERADRRPLLSDLRESGQIEQDADIVAFLYRDEYYEPESLYKGYAELITAKQRNGPTGMDWLASEMQFSRFRSSDAPRVEVPPAKFAKRSWR